MKVAYEPNTDGKTYWCKSHHRIADWVCIKTEAECPQPIEHCCGPNKGGILLPCFTEEMIQTQNKLYTADGIIEIPIVKCSL
jgi:hypothetical protein